MCVLLKLVKRNVQALKSKKRRFIFDVISCKSTVWLVLSGYLDSNQGPPAPKACGIMAETSVTQLVI